MGKERLSPVNAARKILEEQDSSAKLAANVSSKRASDSDDMENVDVDASQTEDGVDASGEGDSQSRQKKNLSSKSSAKESSQSVEMAEEEDEDYMDDEDMDLEEEDDEDGDMSDDEDEDDEEDEDDDEDDEDDDTIEEEELSFQSRITELNNDETYRQKMDEHINALYNTTDDELLTEEYREKTKTIFEAAVLERSRAVAEILQEEMDIRLQESRQELIEAADRKEEQLVESIDKYLSYAINEWMEDNKIAINNGIRTEITEQFIEGLKNLFEQSYIDVPNERYDLLNEVQQEVEELSSRLNEAIEENVELSTQVKKLARENIINEATEKLSLSQREKVKTLVEDVDYSSPEKFRNKITQLMEAYITEDSDTSANSDDSETAIELNEAKKELLDEETSHEDRFTDPSVGGYLDYINRRLPKKEAKSKNS